MNHALLLGGPRDKATLRATGAHRIATLLRQYDWDVEVLDFVISWSNEELKEFIKSRVSVNTRFIGYSYVFQTWAYRFKELFDWIRETYPQVKIIVGGMYVDTCPLDAHYYIGGYAEIAILEVIKNMLGTNTEKLRYTLHRTGKLVRGLHDYPAYPISTLEVPIEYQNRDFIHPGENLVFEASRGCKFKCDFCSYPILGVKGDVTRTAESYKTQLQKDHDMWGTTMWNVTDETFNDSTEKLEKYANVSAHLSFKPYLVGYIRADLMASKKQDWPLLAELGMFGHYYGIESFNHESVKSIGKGMHPDKVKTGLLEAKDYFMARGYYKGTISMIIGLPGETRDTFKSSRDWLEANWARQSVLMYPLWIGDSELTSQTSKLSSTWAEKGYRRLTNVKAILNMAQHSTTMMTPSDEQAAGIPWENDNMNIYEAMEIQAEVRPWARKHFGVNVFNFNEYATAYTDINDWIYKTYEDGIEDHAWTASDKRIKEYINKKLSWTPNGNMAY